MSITNTVLEENALKMICPLLPGYCEGSGCMMWRSKPYSKYGYCGLAGRPLEN